MTTQTTQLESGRAILASESKAFSIIILHFFPMKYSKPVALFPSIATGRVMYHIPETGIQHRQEWKVKGQLFCDIYFSKNETRNLLVQEVKQTDEQLTHGS